MEKTVLEPAAAGEVDELLARVRARIAGGPAAPAAEPAGDRGGPRSQAALNEMLVQAVGLLIERLRETETRLGLVEEWLREETGRGAESSQRLGQRLTALGADVEALRARADERALARRQPPAPSADRPAPGPDQRWPGEGDQTGRVRRALLRYGWRLLDSGPTRTRNGSLG